MSTISVSKSKASVKSKASTPKVSMRRIFLSKLVMNMGVGRSGDTLEKAVKVLESITDQKISRRSSKRTIREFGIHKGEPIGLMVTVRGEKAISILTRFMVAKGNKLNKSAFDKSGNITFGIPQHIDIPDMKYDPNIGIFGLEATLVFERPGYRVSRRTRANSKIGQNQRSTIEDSIDFLRNLGIEVSE